MRKLATIDSSTPLGPAVPPPLQVQSPIFDGSLGLLIKLVQDKKITLLDIPLAPVTTAYFEYLLESECGDLDAAGAALLAIAYLVERKASLLLPQEVEAIEEDVLSLIEPTGYLFGPAVETLAERLHERQLLFFRQPDAPNEPYQLPIEFGELKADDLAKALVKLLEEAAPPENDHQPNRPYFSIKDKMDEIAALIGGDPTPHPFEEFLPHPFTRLEVVWVFLAMLELIKLGIIDARIEEERLFFSGKQALVMMEINE